MYLEIHTSLYFGRTRGGMHALSERVTPYSFVKNVRVICRSIRWTLGESVLEISVSQVSSKGQVTIPKEIRESLGIAEGDRVVFETDGSRVTLRKVSDEKLSLILTLRKPWNGKSLDYQRELRDEWR
jgi:AbrB family looped-hinge helix DNA binding protein